MKKGYGFRVRTAKTRTSSRSVSVWNRAMQPCGSEAHWATMTSSPDLIRETASSMETSLPR